nr:basic helix-loop-helix family protein [Rosa persica]
MIYVCSTNSYELLQAAFLPTHFNGLDYTLDHHHDEDHQQQLMNSSHVDQTSSSHENNNNGMVNYLMNDHHHDQLQLQHQQPQQTQHPPPAGPTTSFDKLSFADVMQFADFGPKLALNQTKISEEESGIDPVYFLKFPVLNDKLDDDENQSLMVPRQDGLDSHQEERFTKSGEEEEARGVSGSTNSVQLRFLGDDVQNPREGLPELPKNKRKRPRSTKTSQEVESQRMTHIAVERNRRKQMNEHLRVLRSLMPGSYVQRGDQASIIGGAIDFVRELEQLLQCLESQKRRRLLGEAPPPRQVGADPAAAANMAVLPSQPDHQGGGGVPFFPAPNLPLNSNDPIKFVDFETGLREETAEIKSCFADVEVKVLGGDAMIKILSQRRPGQLIKAIAALEDLQLKILHTNITTIEQTVLYCFKVASESRFTAEDIASSVQQIFSFIHANTASM